MISKAKIEFRSKFQHQIPLQFYRRVEKIEICDGPPFFQLSHSGYYFVFSRLRFKHPEYKVTLT